MFTFAYPGLLFLLFLIPGIVFLFVISRYRRRKKIEKLGDSRTLRSLMSDLSSYKAGVRLTVAMIALFGIIFALARPWGGVKNRETSREGIEIVIAVDASNSMLASATGDENGPDRMRTAKLILEKLINRLGNDKVGLIAYAGEAYTLIPVTNDYVSAKAFLNSIEPSMIKNQGTNIGEAVNLAEKSFSEKGDIGKAIILLTDAEELENGEGVIEDVINASKRGIQTDVIGIGSSPVTIPDKLRGKMIDEETGEVVRTALNEEMAIEIAKAGKGIYVNASNDDAIEELVKQLGTLKRAALESSFLVSHDELYYPFVILAIVMLILDFIMTDKKNRWLDKITFFSKDNLSVILLLILTIPVTACREKGDERIENKSTGEELSRRDSLLQIYSLEKERDYIFRGNELHSRGDFERADSNYTAALVENPRSLVASLNSGVNTIRSIITMELSTPEGQLPDTVMKPLYEKAQNSFQNAATPKIKKGNVSSQAYYNLGNMSFTQKDYKTSIEHYKDALRLNPSDDHARRNLRIAQLQKNDDNNQQQQQQQQQQQPEEQQQNSQESQPDRQQINEETSEQILQAAERKENLRRMQLQKQQNENSPRSSRKNW